MLLGKRRRDTTSARGSARLWSTSAPPSPGPGWARRATLGSGGHVRPRAPRTQLKPIRLDRQHEPLLIIDLNFGHVHAWNVEHRIGPGAPARTRATHTVGHRRGVRQIAWSHLILKVAPPHPMINTRSRAVAQPS